MDKFLKRAVLKEIKGGVDIRTDDLERYHREGHISLSEMINNGLRSEYLNKFSDRFLKDAITDKSVSVDTLVDAGLENSRTEDLLGESFSEDDEDEGGSISPDPVATAKESSKTTEPPNKNVAQSLIEDINDGVISAAALRDEMIRGNITDAQLFAGTKLTREIIARVKNFSSQKIPMPSISELPPILENSTDMYFLGMPESGKSCMLASLLTHVDREGLQDLTAYNPKGDQYRKQLVEEFKRGILPNSTHVNLINYIQLNVREPQKLEKKHPINFIDLAGEKFNKVSREGFPEFKELSNYLKNKNKKILVFVVDYYRDINKDLMVDDQGSNLLQVLTNLSKLGIIEHAESIYLVVTKADKFEFLEGDCEGDEISVEDRQNFAIKYVKQEYKSLYNKCKELEKTQHINFRVLPYSIGPAVLKNLLKDFSPTTSDSLQKYPPLLLDRIILDTFSTGGGFFSW